MIHQYAIVDSKTLKVVGKHVSPFQPSKMANIPYQVRIPDTDKVLEEGTCFLSKAQKYWDVVKDPLYLVTGEQENRYVDTGLI